MWRFLHKLESLTSKTLKQNQSGVLQSEGLFTKRNKTLLVVNRNWHCSPELAAFLLYWFLYLDSWNLYYFNCLCLDYILPCYIKSKETKKTKKTFQALAGIIDN